MHTGAPSQECIVILDFGSQYTQLIARRIRELHVFSLIARYNTPATHLTDPFIKGIILSGGPASVYDTKAPLPDLEIFNLGVPILGICYGAQLIAHMLGGLVEQSYKREYGKGTLEIISQESILFRGLPKNLLVWNSHSDRVEKLPPGFRPIARTENSPHAAFEHPNRKIFGLQFHPEVVHTPKGRQILARFVYDICGCKRNWTMRNYIERAIEDIKNKVKNEKVILGLSGGVDSSVTAALIHKAIGNQLTCIFVNNGLLRQNEPETVLEVFGRHFKIPLIYKDASTCFLKALQGVIDPEKKRKVIGRLFIRVFEEAAREVGKVRFLAQGTLYPDVIESVPIGGNPAALIKSHHNVGGLPRKMKFELIEPLRCLFKDEVRQLGKELGLPDEIIWRQPFPGPGLAVRIIGEVNLERLKILRKADAIVIEEMKKNGWYRKVWQSFAVLLPIKSVGVMGDERTYAYTIAVRIVDSVDGMTADWVRIPYRLLECIANRIVNEVEGVNRCVYDITSKPPGTIEWE